MPSFENWGGGLRIFYGLCVALPMIVGVLSMAIVLWQLNRASGFSDNSVSCNARRLSLLQFNLPTRTDLSTKAKRLVPWHGICSEVPL